MTAQPGSGQWRPLAPLAGALADAGHEVAFATTPAFCALIARHGFRCFPAGTDAPAEPSAQPPTRTRAQARAGSPEQPPLRMPVSTPAPAAAVWAEVFAGTRAVRMLPDLLAIGRGWRPDVVVREVTEFGGGIAAERLGIPHAAVQISAWRPRLHEAIAAPLGRLRRSVGLPPDPDLARLHPSLLLNPVPPSFQPPDAPLPPTARAVRHVPFDREGEEGPPAWLAALPARPAVYATLGTAYNGTPGVLPAILEGLREEPITLIVTVGDSQNPGAFGPQPANVRVERYLAQSLVFPRCDFVVCHGGFGTVMGALGQGLPLVTIPIAADQPDNARRCAALGVGRTVAPGRRTAEAIREAAREVLGGGGYRRNAEGVRDEMRALPALDRAVGWLERLTATGEPADGAGDSGLQSSW